MAHAWDLRKLRKYVKTCKGFNPQLVNPARGSTILQSKPIQEDVAKVPGAHIGSTTLHNGESVGRTSEGVYHFQTRLKRNIENLSKMENSITSEERLGKWNNNLSLGNNIGSANTLGTKTCRR
ncbi:MAG: hypothetical protein ABSA75_02480 [Candidatus Bathyarchaeia archaeon]|jgi:hypothetical protein